MVIILEKSANVAEIGGFYRILRLGEGMDENSANVSHLPLVAAPRVGEKMLAFCLSRTSLDRLVII
ncbi:MAG: hypothetical protein FWH15_05570 [Betaproteobacteria bacterium]|nr:hypothetical protein [Betaproteobacteria bacterium]